MINQAIVTAKVLAIKKPIDKAVQIAVKSGIKLIKYWIDNKYREKVIPEGGSVIYSDLIAGFEHSGIYIGDNQIANILVKGFAKGKVHSSSPKRFTKNSLLHKKIYVSCNKDGVVGDKKVFLGAKSHIGEESFYGLIISNCHDFSRKCLEYSDKNYNFEIAEINETWEPTINNLKNRARVKLGATKWKLWDWQNIEEKNQNAGIDESNIIEKPNYNQIEELFNNIPLNRENIYVIRDQLTTAKSYRKEISDEGIPNEGVNLINNFISNLEKIDNTYEQVKEFLKLTDLGYSYNQIKELNENYNVLHKEIQNNKMISELVRKMGRSYISKEKKLKYRINNRNNDEIFGLHRSDDLMRMLPNELVNLENEELEYLFYTKFLEKSLLTYELSGKSREEKQEKQKGPIVACLDTSGSMAGKPSLKAKALLLAISKILERENRDLYVIKFGDSDEIDELHIEKKSDSFEILYFLKKGFGGGTNFETPLQKGVEIIEKKQFYKKADILMVTDGMCGISKEFVKYLEIKKSKLEFNIYTVIASETSDNKIITDDGFSDEIVSI